MVSKRTDTVGVVGERAVLRRVLAQFTPSESAVVGPGDDAAVLSLGSDMVVTSDTMIEGSDFRLAWHAAEHSGAADGTPGFELGYKLAATNLSDVAAMGARPIGLTVSLACPQDTPLRLLEGIARGLNAACQQLAPGCGVVGGDLATSPVLTAAITAFGELDGHTPVLRSGAQPGDTIAYAGQLGLAGIGLDLLFRHATAPDGSALSGGLAKLRAKHPEAIGAQLAPLPPIRAGNEAQRAGASAMLDVSDGLSLDAARIAEASGVTMSLDASKLLRAFGQQGGQHVTVADMLTGGEDHGLLATFSSDAELPPAFHPIGEVVEARDDGSQVLLDGAPFEPRGWDPFGTLPPGAGQPQQNP